MARISGVDLPRDKRIEIALTYIFGIGRKTASDIIKATGVNPDIRVKDLPSSGLKVNSVQIFLTYDELLELRRFDGMFDWVNSEKEGKLMFAWASDTEVRINNEDVILSLYFAAPNAKGGEKAEINFTENTLNTGSAVSFVYN